MTQLMIKVKMMLLIVCGLILGWGSWYQVEAQDGQAEVGIEFNDTSPTQLPDTELPYDNTPKGGVAPSVTKKTLLPQTGEMLTHLGILISGMVVFILIFAIILDKQIQLTGE